MKNNLTEIVMILDASGSMHGLEKDTIGGFNSILESQKKEDGDAFVTTIIFNDKHRMIHDRADIHSIRPLTEEEYAGLYDILDHAGSPILEDTPEDVWNIVNEEMSAFLSGMGTAEDCAKKIQSRVEIWLAEHE